MVSRWPRPSLSLLLTAQPVCPPTQRTYVYEVDLVHFDAVGHTGCDGGGPCTLPLIPGP